MPFPKLIPKRLAAKLGGEGCPIAKQFLPSPEEVLAVPGFVADPTCDLHFQKELRLLHKYQGRVLLLASGACAMHCRYCFRQNFPYPKGPFDKELAYIASDPSIHEVILSGGDPLSLSDPKLKALLDQLDAIPHLRLIRFHTRYPLAHPERLTPALIASLTGPKQRIFVLHTNHWREFDAEILAALKQLPCPILTQTVLLKGVNDSLPALKELFLNLVSHGLIPYYLHQLDPVHGTHHFFVPPKTGLALINALRAELPGYAIPRYVQEIPHQPYKTPL